MVVSTDNIIQLAVYQGVVNLAARNLAIDAKERVIRAYARFARLDAEVIVLGRRAKRRNDVVRYYFYHLLLLLSKKFKKIEPLALIFRYLTV